MERRAHGWTFGEFKAAVDNYQAVRYYPITPVAKPRQTVRDKWKKRTSVLVYRAFCDECRLRGLTLPSAGFHALFLLPMPRSWSRPRRAKHYLQAHLSRPDLDNLTKALMDAVLPEDSMIWNQRATKIWAAEGGIVVADHDMGRMGRPEIEDLLMRIKYGEPE